MFRYYMYCHVVTYKVKVVCNLVGKIFSSSDVAMSKNRIRLHMYVVNHFKGTIVNS